MDISTDPAILARANAIYDQLQQRTFRRTDRLFAVLMIVQWLGGFIAACLISPRAWDGAQSRIHPHVWLALSLGGLLVALPIYLAYHHPGRVLTRHVIAISQMLFSSLFIHISGGRIETHFHVFGSLAFLAFYRDWRVLVPATLLVAADHYVRGVYWPQTVFGIASPSSWRWLEHAAWVLFEDVFLCISCRQGVSDMRNQAQRTAELERMNADFRERTAELAQAYQSRNAIVESALDALIGMDIEGRIIEWNAQAERTFQWTSDEALGKPLAQMIIPTALRAAHERGLRAFRNTGYGAVLNRRIEITAVRKDGQAFPVEVTVVPIHAGGTTSFWGFVRDITERHEAAVALHRAKDAAEAASSAKSAFLARMSHEIRTPLNGILGFADVLLQLPTDADPQDCREYVQTIHDSGRHLLGLINDVLDLSKIEAGQFEVEAVRCAPHEIIAEAVSFLRVRAQEKGVNLEYRWASQIPESIVTDPARLRQMLMNLVGNAIKFTERGSVEIVASIEGSLEQARLRIRVVDTGIGMSHESLARVFEPFAQADESITRRFGGTGLGLAICRELAERLGGQVTVQSELDGGSTFELTIAAGSLAGVELLDASVADLMPRRPTDCARPLQSLPAASILLVEDGVTNRKLISLILRRAGARVTTADNGQMGVQLAVKERFDLVLMDMQMPIMDGYTAAAELRRMGQRIPIIALTAHAMKGDEERCRSAGCSGYLTKPIDSERMLQAVAAALHGQPRDHAHKAPAPSPLACSLPLDDPEFREIVAEFVARMHERLDQMRAAQQAGDLEELAVLAHWLKGAGGTAGFHGLTQPANTLERLAKAKQFDLVSAALDDLQSVADRITLPVVQVSGAS